MSSTPLNPAHFIDPVKNQLDQLQHELALLGDLIEGLAYMARANYRLLPPPPPPTVADDSDHRDYKESFDGRA